MPELGRVSAQRPVDLRAGAHRLVLAGRAERGDYELLELQAPGDLQPDPRGLSQITPQAPGSGRRGRLAPEPGRPAYRRRRSAPPRQIPLHAVHACLPNGDRWSRPGRQDLWERIDVEVPELRGVKRIEG